MDQGMFGSNETRDRVIVAIAFVLIAYIYYCYHMQKEGLDNRPRWPLGGLFDHTGAVNSDTILGKGYGLDQSRLGALTNTEGVDFAFGRSTITLDGKKYTEYDGIMGAKEGLDQKEKLDEKTTESALQKKLFSA